MSKQIQFFNERDEQQFSLKDHIIDVCNSYTVIYTKDFFSVCRIFDEIDNYEIDKNRIRVNYSTGYYILIQA